MSRRVTGLVLPMTTPLPADLHGAVCHPSAHPHHHRFGAARCGKRPVHLHWLAAPVLPASQQSDEMIDFAGRWCGEFQPNTTAWSPGMRYRENRTGRTGHEHFPGLIVPERGATNTQGQAYAFHYGWSGGHKMIAEELPDGRRQIQFGHAARMEHDPHTASRRRRSMRSIRAMGSTAARWRSSAICATEIVTWPKPAARARSTTIAGKRSISTTSCRRS
jgi:alpha-galactosidase